MALKLQLLQVDKPYLFSIEYSRSRGPFFWEENLAVLSQVVNYVRAGGVAQVMVGVKAEEAEFAKIEIKKYIKAVALLSEDFIEQMKPVAEAEALFIFTLMLDDFSELEE